MKLFNKSSLILLISVVSINLLCIISVSYAYFTANIKGNEDAKEMVVHAGTMEITYTDSDEVSLSNVVPGDTITKQFRIENVGTLKTKYNIKIDIETNDFEDYSDLTYTLTKNSESKLSNQVLPYEDGYIIKDEEIEKEGIDNYSLTLTFKKDETDQSDNANKKVDFTIVVDSKDEVKLYEYKEPYKDNSGANRPKLYQGMIPITFNDDNTMKIADITQEWYDYDQNKWGNAVLIDNTNQDIVNKFYNEDGTLKINDPITEEDILQMYVWIPRYKYQLFNAVNGEVINEQMINIEFEKGITSTGTVTCEINNLGRETCQNDINGNWYTHPAFTFGETELPGIWVGKFEGSSSIENITILPNISPERNQSLSSWFNAIRSIELDNALKYNLNSNEIDTHVIKNMEWGAMAYLTQSKYGKCSSDGTCTEVITNRREDLTGSGMENNSWNAINIEPASTTGNIYGIYDTNGGAWEFVMGNIVNLDGSFIPGDSGFTTLPDAKYDDIYEYGTIEPSFDRGHLGDGTREVANKVCDVAFASECYKWNLDYQLFPNSNTGRMWFHRGGHATNEDRSGIFANYPNGGFTSGHGTPRVVLTAQDGIDRVN